MAKHIKELFDLTGKTAIVTGGSRGIGVEMAEGLAEAGANLMLCARREEWLNETVEEFRGKGFTVEGKTCDVSTESDVQAVVDATVEKFGAVDVLINNAGIGHVGTILQTTEEDLDKLYNVNVRGIFSLTKAFLPSMINRKYGVIINTSSIGGIVAVKDRLAYCTTKFAVIGFTKSLALDHALEGIRANAICPGRVETPFVKKRISEYPDPQKAYEEMAATQAVGRMATPEEIAAAAVYLASDEAAFVTGTAFEIDGGFSVGK